jgi:hypothetical protein
MDIQAQSCEVEIKDIFINNRGNISLLPNGDKSENSAQPLVRFAPRRFLLGQNEHQMVKLLYRRKPGVTNGEYQGVLAIKCKDGAKDSEELIKIQAALVHNVPVIVRTGKLPIQAEFISTEINENNLQVELKITGQRSLTGTLELFNSASDELITKKANISIYAQQPLIKVNLSLGENNNVPLLLKFTEDPKFGGEFMMQKSVK